MQPEEFVRLLNGKRTAKGKWLARCPFHGDVKTPSLSIRAGKKAILLTCWSQGCSPRDIVESMGFQMSDLWYQSLVKRNPEQMKELRRKQAEEEAAIAREEYAVELRRKWETIRICLGRILTQQGDDQSLRRMWRRSCWKSLGLDRNPEMAHEMYGPGYGDFGNPEEWTGDMEVDIAPKVKQWVGHPIHGTKTVRYRVVDGITRGEVGTEIAERLRI